MRKSNTFNDNFLLVALHGQDMLSVHYFTQLLLLVLPY